VKVPMECHPLFDTLHLLQLLFCRYATQIQVDVKDQDPNKGSEYGKVYERKFSIETGFRKKVSSETIVRKTSKYVQIGTTVDKEGLNKYKNPKRRV
jgi:hypothetical protein